MVALALKAKHACQSHWVVEILWNTRIMFLWVLKRVIVPSYGILVHLEVYLLSRAINSIVCGGIMVVEDGGMLGAGGLVSLK